MKTRNAFSALFASVALSVFSADLAISQEYQPRGDFQGSQAVLLTPWPVFQKAIRSFAQSSQTFEQQTENVVLKLGVFEFQLTNLHTEVSTAFDVTDFAENRLNLNSKNLHAQVQVSRVSIDQVIEQVVDGAIVRVRVQADCGPMSLVNDTALAQGQIVYQFDANRVATQLTQFALQWPAQSWTVSPMTCKGPVGFAQTLQNELMNRLRNADEIRPWMQDMVAKKIQSGVDQTIESLKKPRAVNLSKEALPIVLTFQGFQSRDQGLVTAAQLTWGAGNAVPTRPFSLQAWPSGLPQDQPVFVLPQDGLGDYVSASVLSGPPKRLLTMKQFKSFNDLMHSRLVQFFVWPDLFHYAKDAPFMLQVNRPETFSLRWTANGKAQATFTGQAWLQSVRDNQWWNYLNLRGRGTALLSPSIANGRFQLQGQLDEPSVKAAYGSRYTEAFHPTTFLSAGVLNDLVQDLRGNYSYGAALPDLQIDPLGVARAQSWNNAGGGAVAVPFQILDPAQEK